ncbi:MAG: amidase [Planctomycetaceae bacterium]|nr:amidase [Planctomycetaceae bacterium]
MNDSEPQFIDRRKALRVLSLVGVGTLAFQRALVAQAAEASAVTAEMIQQAEWIAGIELSEEDREKAAEAMLRTVSSFEAMRAVDIGYDVPPALLFQPIRRHGDDETAGRGSVTLPPAAPLLKPDSDEELAFLPVATLAALIRTKQISSSELTKMYLDRLHKYNEILNCVVTFTEDLALKQAKQADEEIAKGKYRGPLHGIPWGAKDLIAYPGYKTTWGAPQFKDQQFDYKAHVAERLDDAGAVLIAKLSLGNLAWADEWYGGKTLNPWNTEQGASGSSAGSASATAAGLVGFSLGSETLGSIVSPCRRCGCSGLRPTFGRVSRHGCMTLAWSMDKIGPICRSLEDCALVLGAIHGHDPRDATTIDRPFNWPPPRKLESMRVGYFGEEDAAELKALKEIGVELVAIELPNELPVNAMTIILNTEAATVFDELVRNDNLDGLYRWPTPLRKSQFVPAVEYLRANRLRTILMRQMEELMEGIDAYVGGSDLAITNLTGHPSVVLPNGITEPEEKKSPPSITFTGKLYGETNLLAIAHAYQEATGFHLLHPSP